MTICPIAIVVGCEKCPAFKFCPLTTVLGDQEKGGNATFPNIEHKEENKDDKYQKYAEEELEKNKKEESKWGHSG